MSSEHLLWLMHYCYIDIYGFVYVVFVLSNGSGEQRQESM